jgi:hypothetical protein
MSSSECVSVCMCVYTLTIQTNMETRLIQVNSEHATSHNSKQSRTNFQVALGNSAPELRSDIQGFSVESVSFTNLVPNVREGHNTFTLIRNGIRYPIYVPGDKYYSIERFAETLQNSIDFNFGGPPGELEVRVATGMNYDGGDLLSLHCTSTVPVQIVLLAEGLAYQMGVYEDTYLADSLSDYPYEAHQFRTNLVGENALQLCTKMMVGSRTSLDGSGESTSSVVTIPLNVEYGALQTIHLGGDRIPTTVYGPQTRSDLNLVDISLRYLDGTIAHLSNTRMHCTFRVWLRSK